MNLTLTFVNYEIFYLTVDLFEFSMSWFFFKVVYSSENEPALIIFCFSNLTYWFFLSYD